MAMNAIVSDESLARRVEFPDTDDELTYPSYRDWRAKPRNEKGRQHRIEGTDHAVVAWTEVQAGPDTWRPVGYEENDEDEVSFPSDNRGKCQREAHVWIDDTHSPMPSSLHAAPAWGINLVPGEESAGVGKYLGNGTTIDCPEDDDDDDDESAEDIDDDMCSICLEAFVPGERASLLLECEHMFHRDCLKEWWRRSPNCPNCRERMVWPCVCMVI